MKEMERKDFKFTIQDEPDEKGVFRGYASVFGVKDFYGEVVDPGAFRKTLKTKKFVPLLWYHAPTEPLGIVYSMEDSNGLFCEGHLNLDVQSAIEKRSLMKQGAITGISIGFQTVAEKMVDDEGAKVRHIRDIDLWEESLCVFQACPGAVVSDVKSMLPDMESAVEAVHRIIIGWTTDKNFSLKDEDLPMLAKARDEIDVLLKAKGPIQGNNGNTQGIGSLLPGLDEALRNFRQDSKFKLGEKS
ncbi:MAG: HK97 family phage prohead protease [Smithellaceae bacterium]|jgi:hypothetical protein